MWWFSTGAPGVAEGQEGWLGSYRFGVEMIVINSIITFTGMLIVSYFPSDEAQKTTMIDENSTV
jgi:hypothetical protein